MKFSWDFQQKLQYAGVVAVVTIALMFIMAPIMAMLQMVMLGLLIYAIFFLQESHGPVKPWQSKGLITLTVFGSMGGRNLMGGIMFGDFLSLAFFGISCLFIYMSAQRDPVDIEM
ncbi:MAG: hypothetical protein OSB62_01585 [Alphaproteobacteria bacterium]|nr:hypothetical protein [Alphaproteobacteria bacterium]